MWWHEAVVYQIYLWSFADGNGDGVGDLAGLRQQLDHLAWLGVDALWLSPIYRSPMADFGYDVSDHCDVDHVFGTLADADALIAEAHERGALGLVPADRAAGLADRELRHHALSIAVGSPAPSLRRPRMSPTFLPRLDATVRGDDCALSASKVARIML